MLTFPTAVVVVGWWNSSRIYNKVLQFCFLVRLALSVSRLRRWREWFFVYSSDGMLFRVWKWSRIALFELWISSVAVFYLLRIQSVLVTSSEERRRLSSRELARPKVLRREIRIIESIETNGQSVTHNRPNGCQMLIGQLVKPLLGGGIPLRVIGDWNLPPEYHHAKTANTKKTEGRQDAAVKTTTKTRSRWVSECVVIDSKNHQSRVCCVERGALEDSWSVDHHGAV